MVKIKEYIGFCVQRRSYLLGSPVIPQRPNGQPRTSHESSAQDKREIGSQRTDVPGIRPILHTLEVLLFYQPPLVLGYSRVLPGLLVPVTGTSSTSYSPSIWAPGSRVPGYSLYYVRNPRYSNFSFPNLGPLGNLSYDIVQETLSKMEMLSDASRLTVTYMSSTLYSPSIWAPGPGAMFKQVPGYSVDYLRNTWHGNLSSPKSRPLGTITNDIFRKTHFKMKENAASCLSPHPPVL